MLAIGMSGRMQATLDVRGAAASGVLTCVFRADPHHGSAASACASL
jgi:hypothetical protein